MSLLDSFIKPTPRRRRSPRGVFRVEACEQRVVPAGNVTVVFNAGTVTVTGDDAANVVDVNVVANQVIVQGFQGTTVNGSETPFVVVPAGNTINDHLVVNLGNGKDVLSLRNVRVNRSIIVDMGAGNDRVVVDDIVTNPDEDSDINIELGLGKDQAFVDRVDCGDSFRIGDDGGRTLIALNDVQAADDVILFMGPGRQEIVALNVEAADRLSINLSSSSRGTLFLAQNSVDRLAIIGSDGPDVVLANMDTQNAGLDTVIELGNGRDSLLVEGTWQTPTTLDGQEGRDALFAQPNFFTPNGLFKQGFETDIVNAGAGDIPQSVGRRFQRLFLTLQRAQNALQDVLN